ncbi:hypothetical protein VTJ04DRAFT_10717 [Mycothermus thermophilus]|uniref:uncharacterized protein n=1 Tax=Humicola insolens TaxID=85995 RepID=UPI0037422BAC
MTSRLILPALKRLGPPNLQEFCLLREWPFYWKCQRQADGSFRATLKDVTNGRGFGAWPAGLYEEGCEPEKSDDRIWMGREVEEQKPFFLDDEDEEVPWGDFDTEGFDNEW